MAIIIFILIILTIILTIILIINIITHRCRRSSINSSTSKIIPIARYRVSGA